MIWVSRCLELTVIVRVYTTIQLHVTHSRDFDVYYGTSFDVIERCKYGYGESQNINYFKIKFCVV